MVWVPFLDHAGCKDLPLCILVTLISAFIIWKHRSNIGRLVRGEENKIFLFKKGKGQREEGREGGRG